MRVFFMGGAGNEFFQVARALCLKKLGFQVVLVDLQEFKKPLYKLLGNTYHAPWIATKDVANHLGLQVEKPTLLDYLLLTIMYFLRKLGCSHGFDRPLFTTDGRPIHQKLLLKLDVGYFQSKVHVNLKSISEVSAALIHVLSITSGEGENNIVVHVRGGDVIAENRISEADVKGLLSFCKDTNTLMSCITNDPEYAKSKFQDLGYDFLSKGNARDHFIQLASSKKMYVSNSTFAFWALVCANQFSKASAFGPNNWEFDEFIEIKNICGSKKVEEY